ncbi:hypothetical protein RP20_CCG020173 [Aedes albopictus]|nr:hypothetical protein RP20_CCG020173 [Aedes albopictus]
MSVPQPDARSFAKEETIKVLNLLEEAEGFTELRKRIFDSDVDQLVDGLKNVESGIRWSEMLNALQKLVTEKKLDSGEQIVGVLEQWKTGVRGQLDNGYFNRTYGEGANGEAHKVGDYDEDAQQSRDYDTEEFHPVDANHPDIAYLIPHIIHQLRLGNISEQEQLTMAAIFEDQWPLIVEEAFRSEQEE